MTSDITVVGLGAMGSALAAALLDAGRGVDCLEPFARQNEAFGGARRERRL